MTTVIGSAQLKTRLTGCPTSSPSIRRFPAFFRLERPLAPVWTDSSSSVSVKSIAMGVAGATEVVGVPEAEVEAEGFVDGVGTAGGVLETSLTLHGIFESLMVCQGVYEPSGSSLAATDVLEDAEVVLEKEGLESGARDGWGVLGGEDDGGIVGRGTVIVG